MFHVGVFSSEYNAPTNDAAFFVVLSIGGIWLVLKSVVFHHPLSSLFFFLHVVERSEKTVRRRRRFILFTTVCVCYPQPDVVNAAGRSLTGAGRVGF